MQNKAILFSELTKLLIEEGLLDEKRKANFQDHFQCLTENPVKYQQVRQFIENNDIDDLILAEFDQEIEDKPVSDPQYSAYVFLRHFIRHHFDDWKYDEEYLAEFVSEFISQPFEAPKGSEPFELIEPFVFNQKLEQETGYSLMNLNSGGDDYAFFVCRTFNRDKLLYLAKALDLPLNGFLQDETVIEPTESVAESTKSEQPTSTEQPKKSLLPNTFTGRLIGAIITVILLIPLFIYLVFTTIRELFRKSKN